MLKNKYFNMLLLAIQAQLQTLEIKRQVSRL